MPTLVVDNLPPAVFERLQRRAEAGRRSVRDEAVALLEQALGEENEVGRPRLPDLVLTEEIAAPCDLPRPGPAVRVQAHPGGPRLPDPLD